ncbi:3-oxoacyl-ACP reductase family protein [Streptomyces boncukensis]|uniref:3-oxoacyl-ACP reductase FabG n=1 Tax=Streptomyces boncukensis TaxID=2711219 RepID=A0A6G4WV51_9ACTN|nr:3-oxoacyl-ACP reductase family protein [Streptomyces boncukensis]NGO68497.1 3-oxoacyl-ACP reductase FabG [Streptomyces boncukensis]
MSLNGKVALVTGGSRGIGAATAVRLAREGADVALTYAGAEQKAQEVAEEIRATGRRALVIRADSADAAEVTGAVDQAAAELGRLDILVNNAGVFPHGPFEDVTVEELDRTLAIHVRGTFLASQAAVRHMTAGGRIISVGSNLADRVPFPGITLYAASKAALNGFTKGLARDLGGREITVNVVHPGSTATDMNPPHGEGADAQRAISATGRYAEPSEQAALVAFLAGPEAGNITGSAFTMDGGSNA